MNVAQETLDAMRAGNFARNLPKDCFPEIASLLEQSKDTRDRQRCYWMLGNLASLTKSPTIGDYAATRFGVEKTVKLKVEALRAPFLATRCSVPTMSIITRRLSFQRQHGPTLLLHLPCVFMLKRIPAEVTLATQDPIGNTETA